MYFNFLLYILFIIIFVLIFFIIDKKYCEEFTNIYGGNSSSRSSSSSSSSSSSRSSSSSSSSEASQYSIFKSNIMAQYKLDSESIRNLSNLSSKIYNSSIDLLTIPGYLNIEGTLNIFPIGQIAAYSAQPNPQSDVLEDPPGWLICDGRTVQTSKYLNLYNILKMSIDYMYDTSETFQIPDYRGLFLKGANNNNLQTYNDDCINDHLHIINNPRHRHSLKLVCKPLLKWCNKTEKYGAYNNLIRQNCVNNDAAFGGDGKADYILNAEVMGYIPPGMRGNGGVNKGTKYLEKKHLGQHVYIYQEWNDFRDARGKDVFLRGLHHEQSYNLNTSGITLNKIIGIPSENISVETRPYNWSINWIIKY